MVSVDPAYHHRAKTAHPAGALQWGTVQLKGYNLAETHLPVAPAITTHAKAYLNTLPSPDASTGFTLLHRCGETFQFLLLHLWRKRPA